MTEQLNPIVSFVEYVLGQLLDKPSEMQINAVMDDRGGLVTVQVAEDDMGKLIGRNGQTITSLRLLVRSMGARIGVKTTLKVLEDNKDTAS